MKDMKLTQNACTGILLVICLLIGQQQVNAGYTMAQTCEYVSTGYIGDPSDCQGWGYCSGGVVIASGKCKDGLLFDIANGICNYAADVECRTTVENVCANINQPQYIGDPNNCNTYCYCLNGVANCNSCPKSQVFNPSTTSCVWSNTYTCSADSVCRLVPNNKFVGNPDSCGAFLRCVDGSGIAGTCSSGVYDKSSGNCVDGNPCSGSPTTPDATPSPDPSVCTTGGPAYVEDPNSCAGYYNCPTTGTLGTWGKCPFATFFDEEDQQCVTPYETACRQDRCQNLNLEFVAKPGCLSYSYCKNSVAVASYLCSDVNSKFPYFDEFYQACVESRPDYVICTAPVA
ncbi:peritrophin-44 [Teleopsis dalmanni]|uniref:peritrophin-44 n=1 Tax=Teleopsis dalmanni TaxID=139649 RepID=UPI0018CEF624|nr:peritrophin-44 [Teleopsis dalmanni]